MGGGGALAPGVRGALACVLALLLSPAQGHVSLMWPPARGPGLDFLDTFRTPGECGVKPDGQRTLLKAGGSLNVSWHLGYSHRGGYRLELVSKAQGLAIQVLPLASSGQEWQTEEARYRQNHLVTLPQGVECEDCYLKLERQSLEWGKNYRFRSCADVRLAGGVTVDCGEGRREGGQCVCPRGRLGDRCQYSTDCQSDNDCNGPKGQGKCVVTDSTIYRIGQCFCTYGWQGEQCQKKTQWTEEEAKTYTEADYKAERLGEGVSLLWRRLEGGEVELILSAPTTSWLALGWRPQGSTKACQDFPSSLGGVLGKDFHPMDCTDMVVGAARGGRGRVGDFYTRDRSTPRPDKDYGGQDDLTSSVAWEEDGVTTIRIVRQSSAGVADHPLEGPLHVIWAYGHGQYSDGDSFYREDQLKYHGGNEGGDNRKHRGITVLDLGQSSTGGPTPLQLGLGVSCVLLLLLLGLQVAQNFDRKLSCINPFTYRAFN